MSDPAVQANPMQTDVERSSAAKRGAALQSVLAASGITLA